MNDKSTYRGYRITVFEEDETWGFAVEALSLEHAKVGHGGGHRFSSREDAIEEAMTRVDALLEL